MRYCLVAFFLCSINFTLLAQDYQGYSRKDTLPDSLIIVNGDTLPYIKYKVQPYVEGILELSNSPDGYLESYSVGGGIIFDKHWIAGAQFTSFAADLQQLVIFPNIFTLSYMHGGFHVGYRTHYRKLIDLVFLQKISSGEMSWQNPETDENVLASRFTIIHPAIGVDVNLTRFVKVHGNIGYRFVTGLDLAQAPASDFQGVVFQLSLKAGVFNYIKR